MPLIQNASLVVLIVLLSVGSSSKFLRSLFTTVDAIPVLLVGLFPVPPEVYLPVQTTVALHARLVHAELRLFLAKASVLVLRLQRPLVLGLVIVCLIFGKLSFDVEYSSKIVQVSNDRALVHL